MLPWIGFAAGAALCTALSPVFIKAGARRTAPAIGAWVFSFAVLCFALGTAYLADGLPLLLTLGHRPLLLLSLAGLSSGCMWLCLFRALAGGQVNRVMPAAELSSLLVLGGTILFFDGRIWLWRACYILLVLIGTVLMESRRQRARSAAWLLYALCAAVFSALGELIARLGAPDAPFAVTAAVRAAVAFVFLTVLAAAGRSFGTVRQMGVSGWCFTLLAAACTGGALLLRF